ncbi:MAG: hypothetical protein IKK93_00595 [Campylobacter sp.]|nr:hypothetical protein [Campylobacter sp.]
MVNHAELARKERQDKLILIWSLIPDFEHYFKTLGSDIEDQRTLAQLLSNEASYMKNLCQNDINILMDRLGVDEPRKILYKVCEVFINDYLPSINVRTHETVKDTINLRKGLSYSPEPHPIIIKEKFSTFIKDKIRSLLVDEKDFSEEKDLYFIIFIPFIIMHETKEWYGGEFPPLTTYGDLIYA